MAKFVKSLHCHFSVVFINHVKYYTLYNAFSLYLKLCSCDWEGEKTKFDFQCGSMGDCKFFTSFNF